jgi:C4-type Zn-finger protein
MAKEPGEQQEKNELENLSAEELLKKIAELNREENEIGVVRPDFDGEITLVPREVLDEQLRKINEEQERYASEYKKRTGKDYWKNSEEDEEIIDAEVK